MKIIIKSISSDILLKFQNEINDLNLIFKEVVGYYLVKIFKNNILFEVEQKMYLDVVSWNKVEILWYLQRINFEMYNFGWKFSLVYNFCVKIMQNTYMKVAFGSFFFSIIWLKL